METTPVFPELSIIIVNYNLRDDLIECIDSLLIAGASLNQIIVVDNCSTDDSVKVLTEKYCQQLTIILAEKNKGYPYGLNLGIPRALENGAQWLLLMNNDVVVASNFLYELKIAVTENPSHSLFAPMILYHEAPDTIWYLGQRVIPGTLIGIGSYRGHKDNGQFSSVFQTDFVHGCTMLVRKNVFEKIGLFDDSELIYGDDADFSWRAHLAGFKMLSVPRAKLWHKIALTMGRHKPKTRYLRIKTSIKFYRKYSHGIQLFMMFIFTTLRAIIIFLKDFFTGRFELIAPLYLGWKDGWTNQSSRRN